ncbi:MAG: Fe-S cluster assembly protein SufD [Dehalococcoidia bacterium]|tara:strand:+ start:1778 stop:3085 length:1308 start_codon:yes stop_codon:yes gene_type:complete
MQDTSTIGNQYEADFQDLCSNLPNWSSEFRNEAMIAFKQIGLPVHRKGNEKWKYTNARPIAEPQYELAKFEEMDLDIIKDTAPWHDSWLNVVFVNGHYQGTFTSNTSSKIQLTNIAANDLSQDLANSVGGIVDYSDDGFAAWNSAFMSDGSVISVPDGENSGIVINLIFFNQGLAGTVNHPRVLVNSGKKSTVNVIENYVGGGEDHTLTNSVSEIYVGEGSTVNHYRLMSETDHTYDVGYGRVKIDTNGTFNSRAFFRGCGIGRYDLNVLVDGENASCDLQGLYFTSGNQHMDNFINIDHSKPHCQSNLFYKGILDGNSRAVFGGTVLVRKEAQKTDSIQSDKNLILSPNAEVDSKPALFIYADDVKCAHGATAGNIDADTVFYMRSRGVDLETASRLIIYGFAGEVIDKVEIEGLRSYLEEAFLASLPSHRFEF